MQKIEIRGDRLLLALDILSLFWLRPTSREWNSAEFQQTYNCRKLNPQLIFERVNKMVGDRHAFFCLAYIAWPGTEAVHDFLRANIGKIETVDFDATLLTGNPEDRYWNEKAAEVTRHILIACSSGEITEEMLK